MPAKSRAAMIRIATVRAIIVVAASLVLGIPVAPAQTVPTPPPTTAPASPQDAAEQRVRSLQAELHITDAQMPQWSTFAQAMRDNAISTGTLFRQRASSQSMSALDNMKSYAQVARAYADNTENLSVAFEALYGVLSDQQKQTIDTLFRQQPAQSGGTQPPRR
jgi:periplasmic protein CpxP/Spy